MRGKRVVIRQPDGSYRSQTQTVLSILDKDDEQIPSYNQKRFPHLVIDTPEKWRKFRKAHNLKGYRRITVKI